MVASNNSKPAKDKKKIRRKPKKPSADELKLVAVTYNERKAATDADAVDGDIDDLFSQLKEAKAAQKEKLATATVREKEVKRPRVSRCLRPP